MRISCESCGKNLELPDEKVPQQTFAVSCPSCKNRIVVDPSTPSTVPEPAADPTVAAGPAPEAPHGEAPHGEATPDPAESTTDSESSGPRLPTLRAADQVLMRSLPAIAFVANLDVEPSPAVDRELQRIGMEEVRTFGRLEEACEALLESEAAVLLVRMTKASAPPCEALEPIYRLPFDTRRSIFVALMADNVKSLDGQVAFYLQVNCLLSARDMGSMAANLRRALLHHLRLYRHWDVEV